MIWFPSPRGINRDGNANIKYEPYCGSFHNPINMFTFSFLNDRIHAGLECP